MGKIKKMDKKYLGYNIEELIEDKSFISFSLKNQNKDEWDALINEHYDFSDKVKTARGIILLLRDSEDLISENEIDSLWNKIEMFEKENIDRNKVVFDFRSIFKYAAVLAILMTILGIGYLYFKRNDTGFQFTANDLSKDYDNAKLLLSNGQEIDLKKIESKITVDGIDKVIHVNNDTIIGLNEADNKEPSLQYNEVVVPYGKKSLIELEDGTKVWLNAGSRFAFPSQFARDKREVFLKGEAYFIVAHNESKPFFVKINDLTCKVLGTTFDISAYDTDTEIKAVLVEGKIAISENSTLNFNEKQTILIPNQKAVFNKEQKTIIVTDEANVELSTAWVNGWFSFSKENLLVIFNKLERYYNIKFIYDKSFVSNDLISGKLDLKDSVTDVLETLSGLSKISYQIENDNIYITESLKLSPMKN